MNRPADPFLQDAALLGWPQRNQHWLALRFAGLRGRIERHARGDTTELPEQADAQPADDDFEPAAERLASAFGLSRFEAELLVLAAGIELDAELRGAVARAQNTLTGRPVRLGYSLALALLPEAHWDALAPPAPLRHWSLVDVDVSAGFNEAQIRLDERVLHYLCGVAAFDERLLGLAWFHRALPRHSPLSGRIGLAMAASARPLAMLSNATPGAAARMAGRELAHATFAAMGLAATLCVDATTLADACAGRPRDLLDVARRIDREAALADAGVVLLPCHESRNASSLSWLAELRGPVIVLGALSTEQLADMPRRAVLRFSVPAPLPHERNDLPAAVQRAARRAEQQFRVDPALFDQALDSVAHLHDEAAIDAALWRELRECARGGLDALAERIDSRTTFDDLVLPPHAAGQLREMSQQLRHRATVYDQWGFAACNQRGLGIAALFAGDSGTGKTLAAEAVANEAGLDLYRIDLASVVSKYIGETEKNMSRLFTAAEDSGAVLLFDESEALFGKRSEVKDSHDRYANIEVAYLLQRIESYRGLAILTTNLKSALDRAFLRRIRFVVQFPFPDEAARERLWRLAFPAEAPLGGLDFKALARINVAGGSIRSMAVNAAFIAAERGSAIDADAVMQSVHNEFAKLERVVPRLRLEDAAA